MLITPFGSLDNEAARGPHRPQVCIMCTVLVHLSISKIFFEKLRKNDLCKSLIYISLYE